MGGEVCPQEAAARIPNVRRLLMWTNHARAKKVYRAKIERAQRSRRYHRTLTKRA